MRTSFRAALLSAVAMAGFISQAQAQAEEESAWGPFSAGAALTSDYRFRGISQSDRDAAFQFWGQYTHDSGFYLNVWGSTIDFNDEATYDSSIEIDLTAGYTHKFTDATEGGIKFVYYWYPDADAPPLMPDYDYLELIGSLSHDFGAASVSGEIAWSPDYFGETGDAVALTGGLTVPLMETFAFFDGGLEASAHLGYQWIDLGVDYTFWDIGATASFGVFALDVRYVDTDQTFTECFLTENCDGGVVVSLSAELPG